MFSERTLAFWQGRIEILTVAAARHRERGEQFLAEQCDISAKVYRNMIKQERGRLNGKRSQT
jgi:hypothetical protein